MSNNFDWNSMLGGGTQPPSPAPPPEPAKQPTTAPVAQDDANALFNADTQQAIRDSAEKAKATTKAAAVGMVQHIKRLASVVRLRWVTARMDRTNRRLERQVARADDQPAPRATKTWASVVVAVALIGGLAVGGWLHLRKPDSAPAATTQDEVKPTPAPTVVPVPATVEPEPLADPIADLDEPAPAPAPAQATPVPQAPAPQAKPTATAVEVAKPLPPKPRPKADARADAPHDPEPKKSDDTWQDKANADLDSFFNQNQNKQ